MTNQDLRIFTHYGFAVSLGILALLSGCASTQIYDTGYQSEPDSAQINLKRKVSFVGSGNAILIMDAGKGAIFNAVLVELDDYVWYAGPEDGKAANVSYPVVGTYGEKTGVDLNVIKDLVSKNEFTSLGDAKFRITEFGEYVALSEDGIEMLQSVLDSSASMSAKERQKRIRQTLVELESDDSNILNVRYMPVSIIGQIKSDSPLQWSRPPGELSLRGFTCLASCEGEEGLSITSIIRGPLQKLEAGKEYNLEIDLNQFSVVSQYSRSDVAVTSSGSGQSASDSLQQFDLTGRYTAEMSGKKQNVVDIYPFGNSPFTISLIQDGDNFSGTIEAATTKGEVWGRIQGNTLVYEWFNKDAWHGKGEWQILESGNRLSGRWHTSGTLNREGDWTLHRIE